MTIVFTGSIAFDYLMTFPGYFRDHILPERLETISLSFLVDHMVRQRGGTAPNIAYNLALLGEGSQLMGTVGEDFEEYRHCLQSMGIDTNCVRTIEGDFTASFFANTDKANNQICSFYTGAMAHAAEQSIADMAEKPDLVFVSANDPKAMRKFVQECKVMGIPYIYDPGQQVVRSDPQELCEGARGAYGLFVNDYEFELLQKHTSLSAEALVASNVLTVVTRGEKGADIFTGGQKYSVPVVTPECIADPTGVGDAFRAGFVRGMRLNLDWVTCGCMGALAATYCLEKTGTQNHHYTLEEFIQRYRQHFDDQGALGALLQHS
jgi:adenosine kinase